MGTVTPLPGSTEWRDIMAGELEGLAADLRAGNLDMDRGVIVFQHDAHGSVHAPIRLGRPSRCTEILGLLSYAQQFFFRRETDE